MGLLAGDLASEAAEVRCEPFRCFLVLKHNREIDAPRLREIITVAL